MKLKLSTVMAISALIPLLTVACGEKNKRDKRVSNKDNQPPLEQPALDESQTADLKAALVGRWLENRCYTDKFESDSGRSVRYGQEFREDGSYYIFSVFYSEPECQGDETLDDELPGGTYQLTGPIEGEDAFDASIKYDANGVNLFLEIADVNIINYNYQSYIIKDDVLYMARVVINTDRDGTKAERRTNQFAFTEEEGQTRLD